MLLLKVRSSKSRSISRNTLNYVPVFLVKCYSTRITLKKKSARHGSTQNLLKNAFLRSFFVFEVSKWSSNTIEHTILHKKWGIFGKLKVAWHPLLSIRGGRRLLKLYPLLLRRSRSRKQRVWQRKTKVHKSVRVPLLKTNTFHTTERFFSSGKLVLV